MGISLTLLSSSSMRVFSARFEYFVVAVFIFHFSMLSTGICCIVYDTWEEHFHLNWHNSFNRCTCIHTMYYMHLSSKINTLCILNGNKIFFPFGFVNILGAIYGSPLFLPLYYLASNFFT